MCGWQVKRCDLLVTHESYLSTLRSCNMIKVLYNTSYFTLLYFVVPQNVSVLCLQLSRILSPYGLVDIRMQNTRHAVVAVRAHKM